MVYGRTQTMSYGFNRILVKGLKSIAHADVPLDAFNVLIGANGAGKSNFLAAFRLLRAVADNVLGTFVADSGGGGSLVRYGAKVTPELSIEADLGIDATVITYEIGLRWVANDWLAIRTERLVAAGEPEASFTSNGQHENASSRILCVPCCDAGYAFDSNCYFDGAIGPMARRVAEALGRVGVYHFNDTTSLAAVKGHCSPHDCCSLRGDASNLAAFLAMLLQAHPKHYERISGVIRRVFPQFGSFDLVPDRRAQGKLMLMWRERGRDTLFTANDCSDGTLRFMCLATLLLQPFDHPQAPCVVVIDEPELGLHPAAVSLLVEMLDFASQQVQVIVSTQSPAVVKALRRPESVVVVSRGEDGTVFQRLDVAALSHWFEDYSLGDLWEMGVVANGRPQP